MQGRKEEGEDMGTGGRGRRDGEGRRGGERRRGGRGEMGGEDTDWKHRVVGANLYLHPEALSCLLQSCDLPGTYSLPLWPLSVHHAECRLHLMSLDALCVFCACRAAVPRTHGKESISVPDVREIPVVGKSPQQQLSSGLCPVCQFVLAMASVAKPPCVSFSLQASPNQRL